ncbi:hypothetical protein EHLJMEHL_04193 [Vreelandella titanicae]
MNKDNRRWIRLEIGFFYSLVEAVELLFFNKNSLFYGGKMHYLVT